MASIEHDPLSDIQNIRRLLDVYRPGFAFLKELVQNADDAGASHLLMFWSPGFSEAAHPLLKGPALVAINNAGFTESDKHSLLRLGLGNKGGNADKIGKFGLGTKSIFHVAEAFFFLESGEDPALRDILNPWSPRCHAEWDSVDAADWDRLHRDCAKAAEGYPRWFAVWIPLRRKEILNGVDPIRRGDDSFPGESDRCPPELLRPIQGQDPRLGLVLPLLRHLKRVEFSDGAATSHVFEMDRKEGTIRHDGLSTDFRVASFSNPNLAESWRGLPAWPRVFEIGEDGREMAHPDKAEWSHAIVLTTTPASQGNARLRLYWSVFLPVGNKTFLDVLLPDTDRDISLFLHGFFFLNDSRTEIRGLAEHFPPGDRSDANGICLEWNRELASSDEGLIPTLLPALAKWLEEGALTSGEITRLSRHLRTLAIWHHQRSSLTRKGSLLFALKSGTWQWCWVETGQRATIIPVVETRKDLNRLKQLTEGQEELEDSGLLLAVDLPDAQALHRSDLGSFDAEALVALRRHLRPEPAPDDDEAALLVRILASCSSGAPPEAWCDVPLYRARVGGDENWVRFSLGKLADLAKAGHLFRSDDRGLARPMAEAAGITDAPVVVGGDAPAYLQIPALTTGRAAGWLLSRDRLSADRHGLLGKIAALTRFESDELKALRYLVHADSSHRHDDQTTLYSRSGGQDDLWSSVFEIAMKALHESWRLVGGGLVQGLNEHVRRRAVIVPCSRDSWPTFLRSLADRGSAIDFSGTSRQVLDEMLKEIREEDLSDLGALHIHHLPDGELVSANDESVWLEGAISVPEELAEEWKRLRQQARIVKASTDPMLRLRQETAFAGRVLDASGALKLAVSSGLAGDSWRLVFHFLGAGTPRSDAIEALKSTAWLPTGEVDGATKLTPDVVLHLPRLEILLDEFLRQIDGCGYRSSNVLLPEVREAKGWNTLISQILAGQGAVFRILGELLERAPDSLKLGFTTDSDEEIEHWLEVTQRVGKDDLFGARSLLAGVRGEPKMADHFSSLARAMAMPFAEGQAARRYLGVLSSLQSLHQTEGQSEGWKILDVFACHLRGIRQAGLWETLRQAEGLELLSQGGRWKEVGRLAAPCGGVSQDSLVHPTLANALGLNGPANHAAQVTTHTENLWEEMPTMEDSAAHLEDLLKVFGRSLPPKATGILPALLGCEAPMDDLARRLLDEITVESIREDFIRGDIEAGDLVGGLLRDRANRWAFRLRQITGATIVLESLAGTQFDAPFSEQLDSIFLPSQNGRVTRWRGGNVSEMRIVSPERLATVPESRLREIFLETLRVLFSEAYVYRPPDLEAIVDKFASLGQLSLTVAREEILQSVGMHLQLLGARPTAMEEARRRSGEARARLAEASAGVGDKKRLRSEAKAAEDQARELYLRALDNDPTTQHELVEALRRKIGQHQYNLDSIPFEILQNADDAATELISEVDLAPEGETLATKFLVRITDDRIEFIYGGRPINDACGRTGADAEPWRRDLVKMLLLSGSDKNINSSNEVTGKFGLGFKSVFLLCQKPRIVSGALAFEIVGGIWPKVLPEESAGELRNSVQQHFGDHRRATVISLDGRAEATGEAVERFRDLAPLVPVFLRTIKTLIVSEGATAAVYRWSTDNRPDAGRLRLGSLGSDRYLELRGSRFQWLFRIDDGTLKPMPKSVPWLWVTAPTREEGLGFALNAPFALDPGRTRLSKHQEDEAGINRTLFREGARLLEEELQRLAANEVFLAEAGIKNPTKFWTSLWDLLTTIPRVEPGQSPEGAAQIGQALWPSDRSSGYASLIGRIPIIPTKLPGPMSGLVTLSDLRFFISGWLASPKGCQCLRTAITEKLSGSAREGKCCADSVARELRLRTGFDLQPFRLKDLLLGGMNEEGHVAPRLAVIISRALEEGDGHEGAASSKQFTPDEAFELKEAATKKRFLSAANSWEPLKELLLTSEHAPHLDESMRSAFAPSDRVLSRDYSPDVAALFIWLRQELHAPAKTMAEWVRQSQSDVDRLRAALAYLAKGELRQELALELGPEWIREMFQSTLFVNLDSKIQESVRLVFSMAHQADQLRKLQDEPGWLVEDPNEEPEEYGGPVIRPEDILRVWNQEEALERFSISGSLRNLIASDLADDQNLLQRLRNASSIEGKSAWYRLLCLGCTLDMPRGRQPTVAIKGLWTSSLGSKFWSLSVPDDLSEEALEEVNRKLDPFFRTVINRYYYDVNASGEDVAFWRRVFYDFRKIHHFVYRNHLPETILDFAEFPEADGRSLISFLRSGQIPASIQDPDHTRFKGVIGQSMKAPLLFVMRELRRIGLLDERFAPACFYMNSPARRIASRLEWIHRADTGGGDFEDLVSMSESIHKRVIEELPELASFYDLPLQYFAHSAK